MDGSLYLHEIVALALRERSLPIIADYDLFFLAGRIARAGQHKHVTVKRHPASWNATRLQTLINQLHAKDALASDPDFASHVWVVVGATGSSSAEEVCCLADPFCYVSHLSAMQRYALTDRSPSHLHITRPNAKAWRPLRVAKMIADLDRSRLGRSGPPLRRIGFGSTIRNRPIKVFESSTPGVGEEVRGEATRIASIGRTFVDMLAEPALCGGMHHVLEVWEEHAANWLDDIMAAVDANESKILKVRAGYILEERLRLKNLKIASWNSAAQRGGSSKLDPESPYKPTFSERWMISINV